MSLKPAGVFRYTRAVQNREAIVRDFWRRFTEGRGALGGEVQFYDYMEDLLDDWAPRMREEVAGFLQEYKPDFEAFADRVLSPRVRVLDDDWMRTILRGQVAGAFRKWLESRRIPVDAARQAVQVYRFEFDIRPGDRT